MHQTEFDMVVKKTLEDIHSLLVVKGGEYAGSEDRLANFKRGAGLTGVKPLTVLFIYLAKHYDAISSYVRNMQTGKEQKLSEPIEGRLDDLINYCILAKAIIQETRQASSGTSAMQGGIVAGQSTVYVRN